MTCRDGHSDGNNNDVITDTGPLSAREREVLAFIGQGLSTHHIEQQLQIATSTVETYRERLKSKLNIHSGTELTRHAVIWVLSRKGKSSQVLRAHLGA